MRTLLFTPFRSRLQRLVDQGHAPVGVLVLALQGVRHRWGLGTENFWMILGVVFVVAGIAETFGTEFHDKIYFFHTENEEGWRLKQLRGLNK